MQTRAQDDVGGAHWSMLWLLLMLLPARSPNACARNTSTAGYCALQLLRARQLPRSSREQMPVVFIRRAHKTLFN
jgi:hypothetical protein